MAKKKFSIGENTLGTLNNIKKNSDLVDAKDTFNIQYIDINDINTNPENFYPIEDIEKLAKDIDEIGLQHNLVFNDKSRYDDDKYMILSGERRYHALKYLVEEGKEQYRLIPAHIINVDPIDAQIVLIQANAQVRESTQEIKLKESEKLQKLYEEKKESKAKGEVIGSKRQVVAEAMGISETHAGRYISVNNNLIPELKAYIDEIGLKSSAEISKLSKQEQESILELIEKNELNANEITQARVEEIKIESKQINEELKEEHEKEIREIKEKYSEEIDFDDTEKNKDDIIKELKLQLELSKKDFQMKTENKTKEIVNKLVKTQDDLNNEKNKRKKLESKIKKSNRDENYYAAKQFVQDDECLIDLYVVMYEDVKYGTRGIKQIFGNKEKAYEYYNNLKKLPFKKYEYSINTNAIDNKLDDSYFSLELTIYKNDFSRVEKCITEESIRRLAINKNLDSYTIKVPINFKEVEKDLDTLTAERYVYEIQEIQNCINQDGDVESLIKELFHIQD